MNQEEVYQRFSKCTDEFLEMAEVDVAENISSFSSRMELWCESPVEILFGTAWWLKLYQSQIFGSSYGGRADHLIVPPPTKAEDIEMPDFFTPVWQMDVCAPQVSIGGYRADFVLWRAIRYDLQSPPDFSPKVIIEIDGHDFHEKTKEQAARDKERDRVLQTAGFYVLRFTGSEVWRDVHKCITQTEEFLGEHLSAIYRNRHQKRTT